MGSKAYDANGDVEVKHNIPWGAIRKAALHYKDTIYALTKITLDGITYNIGKQSKEGLVVLGNGYSSVVFFLPDDKDPMTAEDGSSMSIYEYFEMLSTTNYSVVPAWDYFAAFVGNTLSSLLGSSTEQIGSMTYFLTSALETTISGTADFSKVTTAKDFFNVIYENLDAESIDIASSSPLSDWMEEDGAVYTMFSVMLGESEGVSYPMTIGRK